MASVYQMCLMYKCMHQPHSLAVYFAVCTTGFDTPFLSTCMKKGGCTVLIEKNRHGFHPNLNDVLQIIHILMICVDHKSSIFVV